MPKPRTTLSAKERIALSDLHKLLNEPGMLRATLVHMRRSCGRDYCRCISSQKHWHASWYVSHRYQGKPRMQHVPPELRKQVKEWISRYRRAKELLDIVSNIYWDSLKRKQ
jgi:hypothetical protein